MEIRGIVKLPPRAAKYNLNRVGAALWANLGLQSAVFIVMYTAVFFYVLSKYGVAFIDIVSISALGETVLADDIMLSGVLTYSASIIGAVIGALPFLSMMKKTGVSFKGIMRKPARNGEYAMLGVMAVGFGMLAGYIPVFIDYVLSLAGMTVTVPDISVDYNDVWAAVLYIAYVCVIAPIVEEFIFRGAVLFSLSRYSPAFAVVVSSVMFGAMHGNLYQFAPALVIGLFLGCLALRSGSVWAGIIVHAANNIIATLESDVLSKLLPEYYFYIFEGLILLAAVFFFVRLKPHKARFDRYIDPIFLGQSRERLFWTSAPLVSILALYMLVIYMGVVPIGA